MPHIHAHTNTNTHKHKTILKVTEKADSELTKMLMTSDSTKNKNCWYHYHFNLAAWGALNISCVILLAVHRVKLFKRKIYMLKSKCECGNEADVSSSCFYELYFCDVIQLCLKYLIVFNSWNIKHTFNPQFTNFLMYGTWTSKGSRWYVCRWNMDAIIFYIMHCKYITKLLYKMLILAGIIF